MAIRFRDFAAHCQGLIRTSRYLVLEEFARDYTEGKLRLIHPDLRVLLEGRGGDWETVFLYIFASKSGDDYLAFPYAFGDDPRQVMVDIDIRARLDDFHASNISEGGEDASTDMETTARTLGGMLVCRSGDHFETIGFIPVELSVVDAMTCQGVCLTQAIPGYGNSSATDEEGSVECSDPETVTAVEALLASTPSITTGITAQNGSPFLVLRERLSRLQLPVSSDALLARGLDDLAANQLRLWPDAGYESRVMLDGQTGWEIVYLHVIIYSRCEGEGFHTEPMYYLDPSLQNIAAWSLVLGSFSLAFAQAQKAVPPTTEGQPALLHRSTMAAWVVVRDRADKTTPPRSLIYLHHKLDPVISLAVLEEEVNDQFLP